MNIAGFTYRGTQPTTQQDAIMVNRQVVTDGFVVLEEQTEACCFVADGVGRSANGAFASQFVLNELTQLTMTNWGQAVEGLRAINARLISENQLYAGNTATTLAGCVFTGKEWLFLQAGDSEIYLIRHGKFMPLVGSHNASPEAIKKQYPGLSAEKIYEVAANTITSYFGGLSPMLTFDVDWKRRLSLPVISGIQSEDKLLICSDGLFKSISQVSLRHLMQNESNIGRVCQAARSLSEKAGASDNVSMILVELPASR